MDKSKITTQLIAGFATTMAAMCAGFHFGWSSPSLPKLLAKDSDIPITSDQSSWIVSFFTLGSIFGPFIGAALVDRWGRKLSLLSTVIPYLSSCILIAVAKSFWWFIIARIMAGVGMGMVYTIAPMYLGEIADKRIRGALGSLLSLMLNSGILLTYCVGPWVSGVALAGLGGALPLVFGFMFIWMPESPYYLIMKQKQDHAEKSLLWLRGKGYVDDELKKALIIILGLIPAQQFSGISAILAYSSLIFEASGSTMDASISVIIIGAVQLLSGVLTIFIVDLAGRKPLLLISAGSSILFLGGEALYFQLQAMGNDLSAISWLPVTAIIGYIISYTIGYGALPAVIVSEIFPCNVKALATMVATVIGSASAVVVSKLYQVVADAYGIHVCFWGFAVLTLFSGIFIYFILPETKQRSLQSIQEELHKITKPRVQSNKSAVA